MAGFFYNPPPPTQPRAHVTPGTPPVVNNPPFAQRVPVLAKASRGFYGDYYQYGFRYVGGATATSAAGLAGTIGGVISATGALSTGGAVLAGAATDVASATGQLTNFASITLSAPLYVGIGGIFDPNLVWPFSAPVSGSVVWYDPTFISIASNGEISSTSNNCSAQVQFFDGTNWNQITVFLTPFFVAYGYSASGTIGFLTGSGIAAALAGDGHAIDSVTADLTTVIALAALATDIASASGNLTTRQQLAAAVSNVAAVAADLSAQIQIAGSARSKTTVTGNIVSVGAAFTASAAGLVRVTGILTAGTQLSADARAIATSTGSLNAPFLTASANALASAVGALTTAIQLAGGSAALTSVSGALTASRSVAGTASDVVSVSGALSGAIQIAGSPRGLVSVTGLLSSAVGLAVNASAVATALGTLSTKIQLTATAAAIAKATGSLTVDVSLTTAPHYLVVAPYQQRLITSVQQRFVMQTGPLPYAEFYLRVGEKNTFGIDWSEWLANRWLRGSTVVQGFVIRPSFPNGFEYACTVAGESGSVEPFWPTALGATISDGSVTWTCQGQGTDSLASTLSSAVWTTPSGIHAFSPTILGQVSEILLDMTNAVAGTDYVVANTATMSDGEVKIGQLKLKVR